jgi:hypothetical protein
MKGLLPILAIGGAIWWLSRRKDEPRGASAADYAAIPEGWQAPENGTAGYPLATQVTKARSPGLAAMPTLGRLSGLEGCGCGPCSGMPRFGAQ